MLWENTVHRTVASYRLSSAPHSGTLCLREIGLWSDTWILSLSNLTFLDIYNPENGTRLSWAQLVSLLRAFPALEKLNLRDAGPTSDELDESIEPPIPLSNLKDLVSAMEGVEFIKKLLRALYIPSLKSLSLFLPDGEYDPFIEQLADTAAPLTTLLAAEGQHSLLSQLECLRIEGLCWDETSMVEMLYDGLQNLKLLQISLRQLWHMSTDYLQLLLPLLPSRFPEYGVRVRLPRLETLIVNGAEEISLIGEVVRQRKEAGYPIESLYIRRLPLTAQSLMLDSTIWTLSRAVRTFHFF